MHCGRGRYNRFKISIKEHTYSLVTFSRGQPWNGTLNILWLIQIVTSVVVLIVVVVVGVLVVVVLVVVVVLEVVVLGATVLVVVFSIGSS